jgi:hypothetical protein
MVLHGFCLDRSVFNILERTLTDWCGREIAKQVFQNNRRAEVSPRILSLSHIE